MKNALVVTCLICASLMAGHGSANAQTRDSVVNGAIIGAAVGAGAGVAFTHATRDSDLTFSQYARGALIFGAIGAGIGTGVDALFDRGQSNRIGSPRRVFVVPAVWRGMTAVALKWRW